MGLGGGGSQVWSIHSMRQILLAVDQILLGVEPRQETIIWIN